MALYTRRRLYFGVAASGSVICLLVFLMVPADHLLPYVRHRGEVYFDSSDGTTHTLAWVVKLHTSSRDDSSETHKDGIQGFGIPSLKSANSIASDLNLINHGHIGYTINYFLFIHPLYHTFTASENTTYSDGSMDYCRIHSFPNSCCVNNNLYWCVKNETEMRLLAHSDVLWFKQEVMRRRNKRTLKFTDPFYPQQWHLHNTHSKGMDLNLTGLWDRNITGRGVTVCVVDDGLEWTNIDLKNNYSPEGSWDLNDNDQDPMPSKNGKRNEHGTRCAGEIAAARNDFCGVGAAFEASISGLKVLDGKMTDSLEATAFNKNMEINDIYSCSWGPEDDGATVDGPHHLSNMAIENGINFGRHGYGTIYVVASGNGGLSDDNCNYDGYANSIYTVTIGAVDEHGKTPFYTEECSAMLVVTFSSGGLEDRNIVTTDWTAVDGSGCTGSHTGTSAAAPLAAAIIALMLQVRPCLTWRDIQYLLILTAIKVDSNNSEWFTNAAGLPHSNNHGFGLLSAWHAVSAAKVWPSVPWLSTFATSIIDAGDTIPLYPEVVQATFNVTKSLISPYYIWILEYARVHVTMQHPCRGRVEVRLRCPSGTESVLATTRKNDKSAEGLTDWAFSTVRCWGEDPIGPWTLMLTDKGLSNSTLGTISQWKLIIHGTPMTSAELYQRKRKLPHRHHSLHEANQDEIQCLFAFVLTSLHHRFPEQHPAQRLAKDAADGNVLDDDNASLPCQPLQQNLGGQTMLADRTLKILCLTGGFLFLLAIFETLEYMLCYNEEKREFYEKINNKRQQNSDNVIEETPLLSTNTEERNGLCAMEMEANFASGTNYTDDIPDINNFWESNLNGDGAEHSPAVDDNDGVEIQLMTLGMSASRSLQEAIQLPAISGQSINSNNVQRNDKATVFSEHLML